jgi:O-antigen/teichoic acid export membrane protein
MFNGWGFIALIITNLLGMPFQIGLAVWAARRQQLTLYPIQIEPRVWLPMMRAGLPFGLISLTLTIAFSIDTVMLSLYQPEHVIGWYNVAYNLVFSLMFFVSGFKEAIVPSLSRTYAQDPGQVERWYYYSVKSLAILSIPIAVGGTLIAFPLIRFLYTDEFLPSALALQILIWDVPLLMFTGFCGNITTIVSEERAAARIYAINAAANIILNIYAIPRFGIVGASLVTVVTDLIGALQFYFLLRRKLNMPNMTWILSRILLAAALMGLVLLLVSNLNMFLLIGLGIIVYGGLTLGLRLFDDKEWALISRLLRWRGTAQAAKEAA